MGPQISNRKPVLLCLFFLFIIAVVSSLMGASQGRSARFAELRAASYEDSGRNLGESILRSLFYVSTPFLLLGRNSPTFHLAKYALLAGVIALLLETLAVAKRTPILTVSIVLLVTYWFRNNKLSGYGPIKASHLAMPTFVAIPLAS